MTASTTKETYEAPAMLVVEVKPESCILHTSDYRFGSLDEED